MTENPRELKAGWRLIVSAMFGIGLGLPTVPFYSLAVFGPGMAKTFHWPLAVIFSGLSLATLVLLFASPAIGFVTDRFGSRRVAVVSLFGLTVSFSSLAFSTGSIFQYEATWLAIALLGAGCTPVVFTRALASAFKAQRGLALGIALAGTGLFVLLVKPLAERMLPTLGWRGVIVLVGMLPSLIGLPVVFWGLTGRSEPGGAITDRTLATSMTALTRSEALRSPRFWILAASFLVIAFASAAPFAHLDNILKSLHLPQSDVVKVISISGLSIILGRLIGGWLLDRIWAPFLTLVVLGAAAGASLLLSGQTVTPSSALISVILLGLAAGAEVDLLSYLVARYMGVRVYGFIYGLLYGIFGIGAGFGPSIIGIVYDQTGNYSSVMTSCAAALVLAALLLLGLGRYPQATKQAAPTLRGGF